MNIREFYAVLVGRNKEERHIRFIASIIVFMSLIVCFSLGAAYRKYMKVQDMHATMQKWEEQAD